MTRDTPPFPTGLSFAEARAIVTRVAMEQMLPAERLALSRTHGRVLAQDVVASMALPPFDNSAMDGYAVRHCDLIGSGEAALRLIGEQFAGRSVGLPVGKGACMRITTPGNRVSVLATYLTLGRTLLDGVQGRAEQRPAWHARLSMAFNKRHARREFLRGRLLPGEDGVLQVAPNPADGSHRLAAAAQSDALIVLPEGERSFAAGGVVEVLPY